MEKQLQLLSQMTRIALTFYTLRVNLGNPWLFFYFDPAKS